MYKYAIKEIVTNLLDCSTYGERDYIMGDSEIILRKWDTNPSTKYFEEARASIKLSALPHDMREKYLSFEQAVIEYVKSLTF